MADISGDITDPSRVLPAKSIEGQEQGKGGLPTSSQSFSSFMQKPASGMPGPSSSSHVSPLAMMQGTSTATMTAAPDTNALIQQVSKLQATSSQVQDALSTPNLRLKASTKSLLKTKFNEANDHLQAINTKLGVPSQANQDHLLSSGGPLGKFLGYLTAGQQMMGAAKNQLEQIKKEGTHMSPGDFLLVQVKMNKAQQLLEFSSVLLSNAVSDIKQFMQVQL